MSQEEKLKFSSQFENTSKEEEFGEQMLMLIEQAEDTEKPRIIGRLIVAYVKGHFDRPTLMRLCKMVDRAFYEDLCYLKKHCKNSQRIIDSAIEQNLISIGFLAALYPKGYPNTNGHLLYDDSPNVVTEYGDWVVTLGMPKRAIPDPTP